MILFHDEALDDLERIFAVNLEIDSAWAPDQISSIQSAVLILDRHPRIGRPVVDQVRELVISVGKTGYVALYQYEELDDLVRILAIRHQHEAGYRGR